jgi:aryl-alcohol dehydrogenase-like predicted oxidoreductase
MTGTVGFPFAGTRLGVGSATFGHAADEAESFRILDRAYEAGIRFVDTADAYPQAPGKLGLSETVIGRWLHSRRHADVAVATKVNYPMGPSPDDRGLGLKHVREAVDASLRRLGIDAIDLYQAHQFDPTTPLDETMEALSETVQQGKVRYTGVCNWPAWQVVRAQWIAEAQQSAALVSVQARYNLVARDIEKDVVPMAKTLGLGIIAFNPLAAGLLAGRYLGGQDPEPGSRFDDSGVSFDGKSIAKTTRQRYLSEPSLRATERFREFCLGRGHSMVATAVAWALHQPSISIVLLGARTRGQLDESLTAAQLELSPADLALLDGIARP